jgi:hypothetical protein
VNTSNRVLGSFQLEKQQGAEVSKKAFIPRFQDGSHPVPREIAAAVDPWQKPEEASLYETPTRHVPSPAARFPERESKVIHSPALSISRESPGSR